MIGQLGPGSGDGLRTARNSPLASSSSSSTSSSHLPLHMPASTDAHFLSSPSPLPVSSDLGAIHSLSDILSASTALSHSSSSLSSTSTHASPDAAIGIAMHASSNPFDSLL